jgi:hypothetical protein
LDTECELEGFKAKDGDELEYIKLLDRKGELEGLQTNDDDNDVSVVNLLDTDCEVYCIDIAKDDFQL